MTQDLLNYMLENYFKPPTVDWPPMCFKTACFKNADCSRLSFKGAKLDGMDFSYSWLHRADFTDASCVNTNFLCARFQGANLTRANLTGANMRYVSLELADITDVIGLPKAPVIENIDARILEALGPSPGERLHMQCWHSDCGTAHCRAGWAIVLAGEEGKALERVYGPAAAGCFIYAASRPGKRIPDFLCSGVTALADLRRCAEEQLSGSEEPELPVLYSTIR